MLPCTTGGGGGGQQKEAASREEALGAGKEHVIRAQLALGQALSEREDTWRRAERVLTDAWTMVERLAGLVSLVDSPITIGGSGSKGATDAEAKAEDPMTPYVTAPASLCFVALCGRCGLTTSTTRPDTLTGISDSLRTTLD